MTRIKLCGLTRPEDIEAANALMPEYTGFVFAKKSRRYVDPDGAAALRAMLAPGIRAVGVFVREPPEKVAELLDQGIIDIAQLHGGEDDGYIARLRALTDRPIIQAFRIDGPADVARALQSPADAILLDSGAGGTGTAFDWSLLRDIRRPWFLAGGLDPENVQSAVARLRPWAVDVSSGIETGGAKDPSKMAAFVRRVRGG
ncbi:MAG: phosphoribosylanthranilate isomerase [Clostridia bacterium]|nr:phosphoribosylanthranilate isomerase [Clostridia bacterium]